jgi:hypothetical protein
MNDESIKFYLVMQVNRWENMTLSIPWHEVEFTPWLGTGFCRVFDTYEEALKHADGQTIACVEGKRSAKETAP